MGGHAAAFTSPHVFDEGTGGFAHASLRCASSNAVNSVCAYEDAHLTEPVIGRHALLAPPATASIFKRSTLLCNSFRVQALVQRGAIGPSFGRASGPRPRATVHDFDHLSALALASEKAQLNMKVIIADGHFDSGLSGRTDGAKPSETATSSSAGSILCPSHAFADLDVNSHLVPGWVPGAPPKGSSLGTMVLCPPRRQEPFPLPELTLTLMRTTMPLGPL